MPDRLLKLLQEKAVKHRTVSLSSGQATDYYIDVRAVATSSVGAELLGAALWAAVETHRVEAVGAPATGGIALVTATALAAGHRGRPVAGFWVRDSAKAHGTQQVIEGELPVRARCAIIDDVTTTGLSLGQAVRAARKAGGVVTCVIAVVDRSRTATADVLRDLKVPHYLALYTPTDLGVDQW